LNYVERLPKSALEILIHCLCTFTSWQRRRSEQPWKRSSLHKRKFRTGNQTFCTVT